MTKLKVYTPEKMREEYSKKPIESLEKELKSKQEKVQLVVDFNKTYEEYLELENLYEMYKKQLGIEGEYELKPKN